MSFNYTEKRFEQDIEEFLITCGGYVKGNPKAFDRELALDTGTFVSFVKHSQPKAWERYVKVYGADSEKQLVDRFCREVRLGGLLRVLRHGFSDRGIKFRAVFWKPETSLNENTAEQYAANVLHCTRQLHYSLKNQNSIDIVLFVNGIPVVSMELKCQFTGQDASNAIRQYQFDRAGKDAIFAFKERVLVHFAVDLTQVYMTTKLEGEKTFFLPFNQGSGGAGSVGGMGNPNNPDGYDTAYLWEKVLIKDRLLEILHKYMHLEQKTDPKTGEIISERMIFPRYHQLDVVTKLLNHVRENGAGIIITTLQKFPVIYREVRAGGKRFAVIVDEAHSSQTGDAAKKLKHALADTEKVLEEYAELESAAEGKRKDAEDRLLDEMAAHGVHENLSFFAFTATPKDKTLNMFGQRDEQGKYHPFHIYSMRQAIEEGFILDVLKNYMTYHMYYKIIKSIPDDPQMDTAAGVRAIVRFESLHPHNLSQKTAVMLEHFRNVTMHKMGGKAKAMLVTPSRLHAVRYFHEFKRQIRERGFEDMDVLVAFSGEVQDGDTPWTEEKLNQTRDGQHVKETALPEAFKSDAFNILIVAEKYQTGFDEPLLHTMFVDKKLSGVKAVQTLSRLNRTMRGKQDTFVLDFVNTAEEIQKSFEPFYEETVLEEATDPNVLYDIRNTLDDFRVYTQSEVDAFADLFYAASIQKYGDVGRLNGSFRPAVDRFKALEQEAADTFRTTLARFNRIYSFITQVCRMFDKDLHRFSVYAKFLYMNLPKGKGEPVDVDDKVLLEYYRLEKEFEGEITLTPTEEGFRPITGEAGRGDKKKDPLTLIIDKINEKFGTNFTEMDKVLLQIQNDYAADDRWLGYAKNNDLKTFMLLFEKDFINMAAQRYEQNEAFFVKLFTDPDMLMQVMAPLGGLLYDRLRRGKAAGVMD